MTIHRKIRQFYTGDEIGIGETDEVPENCFVVVEIFTHDGVSQEFSPYSLYPEARREFAVKHFLSLVKLVNEGRIGRWDGEIEEGIEGLYPSFRRAANAVNPLWRGSL